MARPNKKGLSYYNLDTDRYQDKRIKRLKHNFGVSGIAVYDYLLCEIYRVKGCFMEWDESTAFDVTEYFGLKETTVKEIVIYCGSVGLFNKELLSGGIITSGSIQSRYAEICKLSKRKNSEIPEFIKITQEETIKTHALTPKTQEEVHKVKERKVNEIKEKESRALKIFEELKIEMINSERWIQDTCRMEKLESLFVLEKLNEFLNTIWLKEDIYKGLKETKSHFISWLKIEKEKVAQKNSINGKQIIGTKSGQQHPLQNLKDISGAVLHQLGDQDS